MKFHRLPLIIGLFPPRNCITPVLLLVVCATRADSRVFIYRVYMFSRRDICNLAAHDVVPVMRATKTCLLVAACLQTIHSPGDRGYVCYPMVGKHKNPRGIVHANGVIVAPFT